MLAFIFNITVPQLCSIQTAAIQGFEPNDVVADVSSLGLVGRETRKPRQTKMLIVMTVMANDGFFALIGELWFLMCNY